MRKFICPNCNERSISFEQRLFLSAAKHTVCPHCKARLKASYFWNGLAALSYLLPIWALQAGGAVFEVLIWISAAISIHLIVHFSAPIKVDAIPT